jgi:hypothetical protein
LSVVQGSLGYIKRPISKNKPTNRQKAEKYYCVYIYRTSTLKGLPGAAVRRKVKDGNVTP